MMRTIRKFLKSSNVVGCCLAACVFIFVTVDHFKKNNNGAGSNVGNSKKLGLLKRKIFPVRDGGDRIQEQLDYQPNSKKMKTILLLDEHKAWQGAGVLPGKEMFVKKECPVDTCTISYNPNILDKADLVISRGSMVERPKIR